jgi:uncharacterized protein (TIGR00369 family)
MSVITEPAQDVLERTRQAAHPRCVVCGQAAECGLGLHFSLRDDGGVEARFECKARFQGYEGLLHGGVTSSVLDGAMTNCLFAHGIVAVTAEMTVRFGHPVELDAPLVVRAYITRSQAPLHIVEAQIVQKGQIKAKAVGKFMERPEMPQALGAATTTDE